LAIHWFRLRCPRRYENLHVSGSDVFSFEMDLSEVLTDEPAFSANLTRLDLAFMLTVKDRPHMIPKFTHLAAREPITTCLARKLGERASSENS
jgi:hypothetical protein